MRSQQVFRSLLALSMLLAITISAGCSSSNTTETASVPSQSPVEIQPTPLNTEPSTEESEPAPAPVTDSNVLYQESFTNPSSGWPEEKFDNYFIGYHEPEYYHVEVTSPHYKTTVFEPEKQNFNDVTVEVRAFAVGARTSPEGDLAFGLVFRRSGDQYYAFTISQRAKKWYVLKSTPNALTVLTEGTDEDIHDMDVEDTLRVDAQGSDFSFHINDRLVTQVTDSDYASGEVGLYAQTFDSAFTHIHFDSLLIRKFEAPPQASEQALLYQESFTNPSSGWPDRKFDNYFIGYHEPEYYHVEITSPNYKTTVFEPEKRNFSDVTVEVRAFAVGARTSPEGDLAFGLVFRRSGDQYYAFTISQRAKKWYVLKSTPNALTVLTEGTDEDIHDMDVEDTLRVDAQGSDFSFHINDRLVTQVTNSDYASGEVGLYAQTFDSAFTHIHFDSLLIRKFEAPLVCTVRAMTLNIRSGPGKDFPSSLYLAYNDVIKPLGLSADGEWIKIGIKGTDGQGWVFNSAEFLTCSADVNLLPILSP